jgi:hypothetical protein
MIFVKMKDKASKASQMRSEVYGPEIFSDRSSGLADIVIELRKTIFCAEVGSPVEAEFVSAEEGVSQHFIGSMGDFPVCVARFHTLTDATTSQITAIVIDRFGVVDSHRNQGLGKQYAEGLVAVIRTKLTASGTAAESVKLILKSSNDRMPAAGRLIVDKLCTNGSASLLESGAYIECPPFPSPEAFVSLLVNI